MADTIYQRAIAKLTDGHAVACIPVEDNGNPRVGVYSFRPDRNDLTVLHHHDADIRMAALVGVCDQARDELIDHGATPADEHGSLHDWGIGDWDDGDET